MRARGTGRGPLRSSPRRNRARPEGRGRSAPSARTRAPPDGERGPWRHRPPAGGEPRPPPRKPDGRGEGRRTGRRRGESSEPEPHSRSGCAPWGTPGARRGAQRKSAGGSGSPEDLLHLLEETSGDGSWGLLGQFLVLREG